MADRRQILRLRQVTSLRQAVEERRLAHLLAAADRARQELARAEKAGAAAHRRQVEAQAARDAQPGCATRRLWLAECIRLTGERQMLCAGRARALADAQDALVDGRKRLERLRLRGDQLAESVRRGRIAAARLSDQRVEEDWSDARRTGAGW